MDLLVADYAMTMLQPVGVLPHTRSPVPVHGSDPGRAFGAQEPHTVRNPDASTVTVYVPVSVRGDRHGVLSITLPDDGGGPDEALVEDFRACADALAHELVVAERDTDLTCGPGGPNA